MQYGPESFDIVISSTAPTGTSTVTLLDTTAAFGRGVFRNLGIARISFGVENSHTGTLKQYRSVDHGTNWDQVGGDISVAGAGATDISGPYDFLVDTYKDWKLEFTTSATQTTWRPEMHGHYNRQPGT